MNNKPITNEEILSTIEFYVDINGVLPIDKLCYILERSGINITIKELKNYFKELNLIIEKNCVYINDFAYNIDKEINLLNEKEQLPGYAFYNLSEIEKLKEELKQKDYLDQLKNILTPKFTDYNDCLEFIQKLINYIKLGDNILENINKLFVEKNLDRTQEEAEKLTELVDEIYLNTPSWKLNGSTPKENRKIGQILSHINMYMLMNGVISIDKLLELLTTAHHFKITKEELLNISSLPGDIDIIDNYFVNEGIDKVMLNNLIEQKIKIPKYKVISNLDKYFEEFDENNQKLTKLINKYTNQKLAVEQIKNLIRMGVLGEFTLTMTLNSNKIILPENKINRMLKDLESAQKNIRIWSLNGYTMNEIKDLKIRI